MARWRGTPIEAEIMEKLRPGIPLHVGPVKNDSCLGIARTDPLFRRIVTFHYRNRMGCNLLGLQMNSQSRVFEAPVEEHPSGTPLRCHRPMTIQSLVPWTPGRILASLFLALVSKPAQRAPVLLSRRRA